MVSRFELIILVFVSFLEFINCQKYFFNNFHTRPMVAPYGRNYAIGSGTRFHPAIRRALNPSVTPTANIAEDRLYRLKDIKKTKKKKFKYFKKHLKKCGLPFLHVIKNKIDEDVDEDYDTIKIKVPYGFSDEYYPISAKNNLNDTELDDDDEDEDEDTEIPNTTKDYTSNKFNQVPSQLIRQPILPVLRPRPKFPMRVPPFKPMKSPVPLFGFPRIVPRRPWGYPVPWRMARPGRPLYPFQMHEPMPGLHARNPPTPSIIQPNIKEQLIPSLNRTDENLQYDLPNNNDQNYWNYWQSAQPPQQLYQPSFLHNSQYSRPDYSSYQNSVNGEVYSTTSSPASLEVVDLVVPQSRDEEKVVTVTPTPIWVFSSQIKEEKNKTEPRTMGSPRDLQYFNYDEENRGKQGNWVPLIPSVAESSSENPGGRFRIVVDDVEIITSKYPTEAISSSMDADIENPVIGDYNGGDDNEESEIPFLSVNGGNSSRIRRRSRIEDLSAVVSGSMTVRD